MIQHNTRFLNPAELDRVSFPRHGDGTVLCKSIGAQLPVFTSEEQVHKFLALLKLAELPHIEAVFIGIKADSSDRKIGPHSFYCTPSKVCDSSVTGCHSGNREEHRLGARVGLPHIYSPLFDHCRIHTSGRTTSQLRTSCLGMNMSTQTFTLITSVTSGLVKRLKGPHPKCLVLISG